MANIFVQAFKVAFFPVRAAAFVGGGFLLRKFVGGDSKDPGQSMFNSAVSGMNKHFDNIDRAATALGWHRVIAATGDLKGLIDANIESVDIEKMGQAASVVHSFMEHLNKFQNDPQFSKANQQVIAAANGALAGYAEVRRFSDFIQQSYMCESHRRDNRIFTTGKIWDSDRRGLAQNITEYAKQFGRRALFFIIDNGLDFNVNPVHNITTKAKKTEILPHYTYFASRSVFDKRAPVVGAVKDVMKGAWKWYDYEVSGNFTQTSFTDRAGSSTASGQDMDGVMVWGTYNGFRTLTDRFKKYALEEIKNYKENREFTNDKYYTVKMTLKEYKKRSGDDSRYWNDTSAKVTYSKESPYDRNIDDRSELKNMVTVKVNMKGKTFRDLYPEGITLTNLLDTFKDYVRDLKQRQSKSGLFEISSAPIEIIKVMALEGHMNDVLYQIDRADKYVEKRDLKNFSKEGFATEVFKNHVERLKTLFSSTLYKAQQLVAPIMLKEIPTGELLGDAFKNGTIEFNTEHRRKNIIGHAYGALGIKIQDSEIDRSKYILKGERSLNEASSVKGKDRSNLPNFGIPRTPIRGKPIQVHRKLNKYTDKLGVPAFTAKSALSYGVALYVFLGTTAWRDVIKAPIRFFEGGLRTTINTALIGVSEMGGVEKSHDFLYNNKAGIWVAKNLMDKQYIENLHDRYCYDGQFFNDFDWTNLKGSAKSAGESLKQFTVKGKLLTNEYGRLATAAKTNKLQNERGNVFGYLSNYLDGAAVKMISGAMNEKGEISIRNITPKSYSKAMGPLIMAELKDANNRNGWVNKMVAKVTAPMRGTYKFVLGDSETLDKQKGQSWRDYKFVYPKEEVKKLEKETGVNDNKPQKKGERNNLNERKKKIKQKINPEPERPTYIPPQEKEKPKKKKFKRKKLGFNDINSVSPKFGAAGKLARMEEEMSSKPMIIELSPKIIEIKKIGAVNSNKIMDV